MARDQEWLWIIKLDDATLVLFRRNWELCWSQFCKECSTIEGWNGKNTRKLPGTSGDVKMANEDQEYVGVDRGYCFFRRFSMSFEAMKRQDSAFFTLGLITPISKQVSLRALVTFSMHDVEVAISRMWKDTVKEMISNSPWLRYLLLMLARPEDVAVKWGLALFCMVVEVSESSQWEPTGAFRHKFRTRRSKTERESWKSVERADDWIQGYS